MNDRPYSPGGDAKVIGDIGQRVFGGYTGMFTYHHWPERGQHMLRKVQTRVVETYGSVRAFEAHFEAVARGRADVADFWTDATSVLFTSFWGWTPETWGTVGWSGLNGATRRTNLMKELTDPFICVCYVTSNQTYIDPDLKGRIAGFYLMSHEMGDRDEFTHPIHHGRDATKWRHSLRAVRAFSYLPEYRPRAMDLFPELSKTARHVSAMGEVITDPAKIDTLRSIPWVEVPVFSKGASGDEASAPQHPGLGMVPAGPASSGGYFVPEGTSHLPRELYVLRLRGDTTAYLGQSVEGSSIIKIGLSVSPDMRRQTLQKAMPRGTFCWQVLRTTRKDGHDPYSGFSAAVSGENAMKQYLAQHATWLGGEFYLASEDDVGAAWQIGRAAALKFEEESSVDDDQ
ncbi:hypothetical protein [Vannielia litorea]|uniref:hypothetical protein n=1 Tax=Vannielia litorea TaxID=1217970 RepID=UPI001C940546|nr:hypothetical protein [Vannielia litorea]MBY6048311.1 hypothetical protein [Vannielia litorea]MBY6075725.1 hypothetical protein [Vannielia litorea]